MPGTRHIPVAALDPEIASRTITLMAPSKTYNIAGLHCSFAIIQSAELRRRFTAARRGLVPGVNVMGFVAALAAYRDGHRWKEEMCAYLAGNVDQVMTYAADRLPAIRMARPEATALAWLDCRGARIPGNPHDFFLRRARVAVNDGATFGPGGDGFIRLNFGCPRQVLSEALDRMAAALRNNG